MNTKIKFTLEALTDILQLSELGVNITNIHVDNTGLVDIVLDKQIDAREYVSLRYTKVGVAKCPNRTVEFT